MRPTIGAALALFILPAMGQWEKSVERPGVLFREDFRETPPEKPITTDHLSNPSLVLSLHGPGRSGIKKSHHDQPKDDPYYVWSGEANGVWAVSLRLKEGLMDLRGAAKIRWRAHQAGFRRLRPVVQLAGGSWLVADQSDGASNDWREREFNVSDLRWRRLNIDTITEGAWVPQPDLARVREVGFTDLMPGGGSAACSRLDWIEVHGRKAE